jgi:ribosome biogenesis GTPase / thiamine phosphate phosphatase
LKSAARGARAASIESGTEAALQPGLVVAAHGRHVMVETPPGQRVLCHTRGKKSDLVVGDQVLWRDSGDEGVIEQLQPRRNLLFRQDEWRTKSFAANLDALLVLVAGEPMFSESQLTRALIAARSAGIPTWIGLNKTDLPAATTARARLTPYAAMGVPVVELALKAAPEAARATLGPLLAGRTTLVLGPSGTGKSTLINLLVPQAEAQVGEISQALNSGRHTTTSTRWYWLDAEPAADGNAPAGPRAALIDSPGFQEFGLRQIAPEDLAGLMPDFAAALGHCKFHNCSHRHEPGCGVRVAMARGEITSSRQRIYSELFEELSRSKW